MSKKNDDAIVENFIDCNHERDKKITALVPDIKINQVPEWLMSLTRDDIKNKPFPLEDVLADSCYYPGCGTDGNPIAFLGRYCQSFIYVDHCVTGQELLDAIKNKPFAGYKSVAQRNLIPEELCHNLNGIPVDTKKGYAVWQVMERNEDRTDDFGPKRLSLVYLGAEAAPAYYVIYQRNGFIPKWLAIVQCSELLDDWGSSKGFRKLVLKNPPQFMFTGSESPKPRTPWCGYETNVFGITLSYKRYDLWINKRFIK